MLSAIASLCLLSLHWHSGPHSVSDSVGIKELFQFVCLCACVTREFDKRVSAWCRVMVWGTGAALYVCVWGGGGNGTIMRQLKAYMVLQCILN